MAELSEARPGGRNERNLIISPSSERVRTLRTMIRYGRMATLATVTGGEPRTALVASTCTADLSIVLLLSDLSQHTIHLRHNPTCALLITDAPATPTNPQLIPRASLVCDAVLADHPTLRQRYLTAHPYAALYADFADFHLWRLSIRSAHYVAGFGSAWLVDSDELLPNPDLVALIDSMQGELMEDYNWRHAEALRHIGWSATGSDQPWALHHIDIDGYELGSGQERCRLSWAEPVSRLADIFQALVRLTDGASTR